MPLIRTPVEATNNDARSVCGKAWREHADRVEVGAAVGDPDPERRAELGRLALLRATNGVDLDISFAAFPFELEVLQRASDWQVTPDIALRTCSAEDLVLYKLVAGRLIDLHDVQSVVSRRSHRADGACTSCGHDKAKYMFTRALRLPPAGRASLTAGRRRRCSQPVRRTRPS